MSGVERVLEIAASTRVLRERRLRALADAPRGALLGREFVTFRGLAERCAAETEAPVRALLGAAETAQLVALCARGGHAEQLRERPGLAGALAATLRDLRDAGVAPDALPESHAYLAATYRELERAFGRLANEGVFDRVGLFRLALRGAPEYLRRRGFARVEVHGATELVGSVGDLLAQIAESVTPARFQFFQPDFQSDYADRLRAEWQWRFAPDAVEVLADPALAPDGDIPPNTLEVRSARSPRAELEGVARAVLQLLLEGVSPAEIQIVARSLEPYGPWLVPILGGYGIPFTSSLARSEIASPERRAWLDLVRVLTRDLEGAPLVRLAGARGLRVSEAQRPEVAALAERIARESAVVRGDSDWRAALARADASPARAALTRVVDRLARGAAELAGARDFASAARCVRELGAELLGGSSITDSALESVARLDLLRAAAGARSEATPPDLERAFEAALLESVSLPFGGDGGGVRVLDAVQARALPCSHLFLVGVVHGAWPRPVTEDPFLSDSTREELRQRLRRPVPVTGRSGDEDRFLLGLLLSQARERVTLSFPETDSSGRPQTPSALLRSLPYVAPRTDVLAKGLTPWEETSPRFTLPADALARAVGAEDRADADEIAARLPDGALADFRAGRLLVAAIDSGAAAELPYDAEIGRDSLALPESLGPSALEELGQCPVRALFRHFLRARALESPAADELEPSEAGSFVHRALDPLYKALFEAGALRAGTDPDAALARARSELAGALDAAAQSLRLRVRERHPTVWGAFRAAVERALDDFLERDLRALLPAGVADFDPERPVEAAIRVGEATLSLKGKIDRVVELASGEVRVGDYKTGRQFDKPLSETRIKRGLALQIALYVRMLAALEPSAELIGEVLTVPVRPERDRDADRDRERSRTALQLEALSSPALGALAALLDRGFFPTTAHDEECRFCRYAIACRISHPPSRARIAESDQARDYLALGRKNE
ncbi:MAG: PD-(D/E)XK nuclease family protein [Myxococcota bacterium]